MIFEEEYYRAGAPGRVSQNGIFLLAPIIFDHGTKEQQDRFLPTMASGERIWAQCWSEPEAGSDLASLKSTARRDDERGGWVLNGQKTWSSRATYAHWGFGLFRSDPDAQRHRGLTYFLFPLDADGVTVRPIAQLDGEAGFAEVFFEDVFVPDADVLGGVGDGWSVAMSTAGNERGLSLRSPGRFCAAADRLVDLYRTTARRAARRRRRRRLDQGAGLPALHLGHGHPARRRRRHGRGRLGQQGVLVRARHRAARDRPGPARRRGRAGVALARRLHVLAVGPDLRRHQRDPAQHRRRADPRPPAGGATGEDDGEVRAHGRTRRDFAASLESLLAAADTAAVARAWAEGDHEPGLEALVAAGRAGRHRCSPPRRRPVELCVAFEALGRHARARARGSSPRPTCRSRWAARSRESPRSPSPPHVPLRPGRGRRRRGLRRDDTLRRRPSATCTGRSTGPGACSRSPATGSPNREAFDLAVLATSAQLLGAGERVLADSVTYVKQRKQFGREIGSYQAIKHALADVRIALDFARPLVHGAALAEISVSPPRSRAPTRRTSPHAPVSRCTARSATPPSST